MQVAKLTVGVEVDLTNLNAGTAQVKSATASLSQNLNQSAAAATNLSRGAQQAAASTQNLAKSSNAMVGESANLGRALRVMTTELLGVNTVTIALGTALGNLATQAATQLIIAIGNSIGQVARLTNEFATLSTVGGQAADSFGVIVEASQVSNSSIATLAEKYKTLAQQISGTTVPLEKVNQLFLQQEQALAGVQQQTIGGAFSKLNDEFGLLINAFGDLFGRSNILVETIGLLASGLRVVRELVISVQEYFFSDDIKRRAENALKTTSQLLQEQANITAQIAQLEQQKMMFSFGNISIKQQQVGLLQQQKDLNEEIASRQQISAANEIKRLELTNSLTTQLTHEASLMRDTNVQQEIKNRLLQIELQYRQAGLSVEEAKAAAQGLSGQVGAAAFAGEFQALNDSLMTTEQLEAQSFERRLALIQGFYDNRLVTEQERLALIEGEYNRHNITVIKGVLDQTARYLQAVSGVGQQAVQILQVMGEKSKGAAKAAIIVNTALQVAQTVQNTATAALRAYADLGPIAGTVAAGAIIAFGAAQVALIVRAGAMSAASAGPTKPPSIPTRGSSGGGGSGGAPAGPAPSAVAKEGRSLQIIMPGGGIFSVEQVQLLIERINEEVAQGATLISTKTETV